MAFYFRPSYGPATCMVKCYPVVFLANYEIIYHLSFTRDAQLGSLTITSVVYTVYTCYVIIIWFSLVFPVFSKAKNKLLSFVSMCLHIFHSDSTGISIVTETTQYQSYVCNSQAHANRGIQFVMACALLTLHVHGFRWQKN